MQRNKRRSLLAGLAIGIGLAGMIFTDGLILGMSASMVRSATDTFLGQDMKKKTSAAFLRLRYPVQKIDFTFSAVGFIEPKKTIMYFI